MFGLNSLNIGMEKGREEMTHKRFCGSGFGIKWSPFRI